MDTLSSNFRENIKKVTGEFFNFFHPASGGQEPFREKVSGPPKAFD